MTTCSATDTTLEPETSSTWIPFSTQAFRSTWSEPTPAVIQIFKFLACGAFALAARTHMTTGHRSYLLDQLAGQVSRVERSCDEDFGLIQIQSIEACARAKSTLTSTMCSWNTLPGPSLSSETRYSWPWDSSQARRPSYRRTPLTKRCEERQERTNLVLDGTEEAGLLLGSLAALVEDSNNLHSGS